MTKPRLNQKPKEQTQQNHKKDYKKQKHGGIGPRLWPWRTSRTYMLNTHNSKDYNHSIKTHFL